MKSINTESRIKDFIRSQFDVDLTDKILSIEYFEDLPTKYQGKLNKQQVNYYLNRFGPMYFISYNGFDFLIQFQGNNFLIVEMLRAEIFSESELIKFFGLDKMGLTLNQLIDIYLP